MFLEEGRERDPSQNQNRDVGICPNCGSGLLQVDEFEKIAGETWFGYFECPDCEWSKTRVLDRYDIDELDEVLGGRDLQLKNELDEMEKTSPEELIGALIADGYRPR